MKTLLIGINAKYIHTNLAIRYLYTYAAMYDVDFVEFTIKDKDDNIIEKIIQAKPDLIGFSCYIWNIEKIMNISKKIKTLDPRIKILLGGPEVSYEADYYLQDSAIDYIISGEGEYSFKALLEALVDNLPLNTIPQLHFRQNGQLIHNLNTYVINFDELPSPHRLVRDLPDLDKRIQYIESSRGCPFLCSYCLASLEKQVRYFPIDRVKADLDYLMAHGAKVFKFLDRTFNLRRDYALQLFQYLIEHHTEGTVFQFEITGELLDEAIIHYLNQYAPVGLFRFEIGIQSTNDYTNQLILRKQNFTKLAHNIRLIQEGGKIDLHLDLIAGLPKEDYQSFKKTFNDVFNLRPHELQLGFLKMLRGTKIRREAELYEYTFNPIPPYEIISNDSISQFELNKIHLAEEILEKYYNTHRFDHTLTYIFQTLYPNDPYAFFEAFGEFWAQHYSFINYQWWELCERLDQFIQLTHPEQQAIIHDLIIYDYLKRQKVKPKIWYNSTIERHERQVVYQALVEDQVLNINLDLLYRYGRLEKLSIHPITYQVGTYYLLKLFLPKEQPIYIIDTKQGV